MASGTITAVSVYSANEVDVHADPLPCVNDIVTLGCTGTAYDGRVYIVVSVDESERTFRINACPDAPTDASGLEGEWQGVACTTCVCRSANASCVCDDVITSTCVCEDGGTAACANTGTSHACEESSCCSSSACDLIPLATLLMGTSGCGGGSAGTACNVPACCAGSLCTAALSAQLDALGGCGCNATPMQTCAIVDALRATYGQHVSVGCQYDAVFDKVSNDRVNNVDLHVDELRAMLLYGEDSALLPCCARLDDLCTEQQLRDVRSVVRFMQQYAIVAQEINALDCNVLKYALESNARACSALEDRRRLRGHRDRCDGCGRGGGGGGSCGGGGGGGGGCGGGGGSGGCGSGGGDWCGGRCTEHDDYETWSERRARGRRLDRMEALERWGERLAAMEGVAHKMRDGIARVLELYCTLECVVETAIAETTTGCGGQLVVDEALRRLRADAKATIHDLCNFMRQHAHNGVPLNQDPRPPAFLYRPVSATADACCAPCGASQAEMAALARARADADALNAVFASCCGDIRCNLRAAISMLGLPRAGGA